MNAAPWEADRPLTPRHASQAISANFGRRVSPEVSVLGSGWEFDVYLTADNWAFRFPRRAEYQHLLDAERPAIELVSRVLSPSVSVPLVELMGEPCASFPYRFAGHRFIPGIAATDLSPDRLPTLAVALGRTLSTIHSVSREEARAVGLKVSDPDDPHRADWLKRGQLMMRELKGLDPSVESNVQWASDPAISIPRYEGEMRVIHHDLGPEHVLVDADSGEITGIIDWTDAELGDPARDFVVLVACFGWNYVEEVLQHYDVPLDSGFRERLDFLARVLSTVWLAEATIQSGDVRKHTEWVLRAFQGRDPS